MRKRWWFLTLLVLLLLVVPGTTAFAEEEWGRPAWRPFTLQGELRGLGESAILVHVLRGDVPVKPYIGQVLLVKVDEATKYFLVTNDGLQEIQFADLANYLGYPVLVSGRMRTVGSQDEFLAQRVLVERPRHIPFTALGKITQINAGTDPQSFKMRVLRGTGAARPQVSTEMEVFVTEDTEFYRQDPTTGLVPITFGDLRVGNLVHVIGTFGAGKFTACKVVVLPPRPVPFTLFGQITEIPTDTGKEGERAFTVKVRRGTGAARGLEGQEIVIVTTENTRFYACEAGDCQEIGFDDLAVGDWVNVVGKTLEGTFTARVVVRRAPPPGVTP